MALVSDSRVLKYETFHRQTCFVLSVFPKYVYLLTYPRTFRCDQFSSEDARMLDGKISPAKNWTVNRSTCPTPTKVFLIRSVIG